MRYRAGPAHANVGVARYKRGVCGTPSLNQKDGVRSDVRDNAKVFTCGGSKVFGACLGYHFLYSPYV